MPIVLSFFKFFNKKRNEKKIKILLEKKLKWWNKCDYCRQKIESRWARVQKNGKII